MISRITWLFPIHRDFPFLLHCLLRRGIERANLTGNSHERQGTLIAITSEFLNYTYLISLLGLN